MEKKNYKKKCSGKDSNHALGSVAWLVQEPLNLEPGS